MASLVELDFQAKEVGIDSEISFGAWVIQQRKALGLTREQLARRVGCSVSGLRKIESDERRPSRQMAELLADCLQVSPDQRSTFLQVARGQLRAERLPAANHVPDRGLPRPPTPLIGREPELATLNRLLCDPRCQLLTLAGPGGIGKTRLALELASTQYAQFPDGVFFVPLASLSLPEFIAPAIRSALGLSSSSLLDPKVQLLNHLRQKSLLLVLDNLEHLLEGVGLLAELLEQAPGVKLLVTSRERLNMQGEWLFDLQGLPVPPLDQVDRAEEYSAVALFVQSAQRAQIDFVLTSEERPGAARICQLVEGMPLAIELAAAWVRLLSCREIAQEIERNLDFLATSARDLPARHRSMRAVFDYSWQMLSAEEQRILRALSVFRGGFLREAAEQVTGASLSLLSALVTRSLVRRTATGRFDLHELVRQYTTDRLGESAKEELAVRNEHMRYFVRLAEAAEPRLRGAEQLAWLDRLQNEHENLRVALEWSLRDRASDAQESVRLTGALHPFWKRRAHWSEGRDWLERALAQSADSQVTRERVKALNAAVLLAADQADTRSAWRLAQENLALSRELEDAGSIARSLSSLGFLLWKKKDFVAARASCERALGLRRELGDRLTVADSLHNLSHIAINQSDYEAAQLYCSEAATIYRELGDEVGLDDALGDLGLVAYLRDDHAAARPYLEESLARFRRAASVPGVVSALNRLGDLARCRGDYAQAEMLYAECLALYRDLGDKDEFPSLLHNLAYAVLHRGDCAQAIGLFKEGLAIQHEMGNQAGIAECLAGIAGVVIAQGKAQQGGQLLSAAEALREASGTAWWPADRIEYEHSLAVLHQLLSEAAFAAAWAEGGSQPYGEVVDDVLRGRFGESG